MANQSIGMCSMFEMILLIITGNIRNLQTDSFNYLPRYNSSPRNMVLITAAMTIDNGLNVATYTGPFKRTPHVCKTVLKDNAKVP